MVAKRSRLSPHKRAMRRFKSYPVHQHLRKACMTMYIEFNNEVQPSMDMLKNLLRESVCEVTFTKVNGDLRTMPCTLKEDMLPPIVVVESEDTEMPKRKVSETSLAVFVTDISEWRSFRLDSIHSISVK